jgi:hypothetical protein
MRRRKGYDDPWGCGVAITLLGMAVVVIALGLWIYCLPFALGMKAVTALCNDVDASRRRSRRGW